MFKAVHHVLISVESTVGIIIFLGKTYCEDLLKAKV